MQQHPVPQNVTQYQFRLVGDMTLKQFLELLGGLVLAYLFYASNLIFIFKWPLALLSIFLGIALAFFPIEDRPLDTWVANFLKSIYRPTRFIWKKTNKIPSIFSYSPAPIDSPVTITKTVKAPNITPIKLDATDLSADESARLSALNIILTTSPVPNVAPNLTRSKVVKPSISIRKLSRTPTIDLNFRPLSLVQTPSANSNPTLTSNSQLPTASPLNSIIFSQPTVKADVPVPSSPVKTVELPATPKLPNLVTGVVVDSAGKLVDSAIVQIIDATGLPARALKTNALGRFFTSTPLTPGTYTIETEKMGLTFPTKSLTINNSVLPAIELRSS